MEVEVGIAPFVVYKSCVNCYVLPANLIIVDPGNIFCAILMKRAETFETHIQNVCQNKIKIVNNTFL